MGARTCTWHSWHLRKRGRQALASVLLSLLLAGCHAPGYLKRFQCGAGTSPDVDVSDAAEAELLNAFYALPNRNGNRERRDELARRLRDAGCGESLLNVGATRWLRQSNVVCDLPGGSERIVVIGAHYDRTREGEGAVDNWTGIALLPFLYRELASTPRNYTYRFIGFGGEERGMAGSTHYVEELSSEERSRIVAMINLDTFGLRSVRIDPRSSATLACVLLDAAAQGHLPIAGTALGPPLEGDWEPFKEIGIPVLNLHSLNTRDLGVLHSHADRRTRVSPGDYYASYRLINRFLALLDGAGLAGGPVAVSPN